MNGSGWNGYPPFAHAEDGWHWLTPDRDFHCSGRVAARWLADDELWQIYGFAEEVGPDDLDGWDYFAPCPEPEDEF
jgi:hypothetical protein